MNESIYFHLIEFRANKIVVKWQLLSANTLNITIYIFSSILHAFSFNLNDSLEINVKNALNLFLLK